LGTIVEGIDATWGLAPTAEITVEANPETATLAGLRALRAAGFTRISLGMQSTSSRVLAVLDRQHTAGQATAAAVHAQRAGFDHVNLDLIYGTPGERAADFADSLAAALDAGADHISAYALIVEPGTRLAARMRRGELPYPDDDTAADRYLAADEALHHAGFAWYEVSNWAQSVSARCRHNLLYWRSADWWGLGPGAHSHIGGVRWWNVRHPRTYGSRVRAGHSPGQGREVLTAAQREMEYVMLRLRCSDGLPMDHLGTAARDRARQALADGLLDPAGYAQGYALLTRPGRLLADAVVRALCTPPIP
jgi:oxygen-independent coproporphyrinogen-3 oxidase